MCDGEEGPGEVVGVVSEIADRRADRAFGRLVVAEEALEHVGGRGAPIAGEGPQRYAGAHELAEGPFLAGLVEPRHGVVDLLERAEEPRRTLADPRKPLAQRVVGRVEPDRHVEHFADRTALHRIERPHRDPFDLVENAEFGQDCMLGLGRVARVGRLVQGGLNGQRSFPEGRRGPADAVIAFDDADLAAAFGEQRGGCEAAEAGADDDGVESVFAHAPPHSSPTLGAPGRPKFARVYRE